MGRRFRVIQAWVLWICVLLPLKVDAVTTTYGGETLEWEVRAGGKPLDPAFQGCEDTSWGVECNYGGVFPSVGEQLSLAAIISPSQWWDGYNCLQMGTMDTESITGCECKPLMLSGTTLFYPQSLKYSVQIVYMRAQVSPIGRNYTFKVNL